MKYAAVFLAILTGLALIFGIYVYAGARIQVTSVTLEVTPAFEKQGEFGTLQTAMDQNALMGTPYREDLPGSSMDYSFLVFAFRLKNRGLIDAEMTEIQPVPAEGDVLSYTTLDPLQVNAGVTVPRRGENDAWCVVLTGAGAEDPALTRRTFRVTYYIWGMPRSVEASYP